MIYLHIGLPKSGSSAIQVYLNENYQRLKDHGVLYPWPHRYGQAFRTSGGNVQHLLKAKREGYPQESVASIKDTLRQANDVYDKVIISSEALSVHFRKPNELNQLLPNDCNIKIVVYLRNQIEKAMSDVNQTIKNAYRDHYELGQPWYEFNDYYSVIQDWVHEFGSDNILIRGYYKPDFVDGDVVQDFCFNLDIPYFGYDTSEPINPSLCLPHLEIMRSFNSLVNRSGDKSLKKKLKDHVWKSSVEWECADEKNKTFLASATLDEIEARLHGRNAKLSEEYGLYGLDLGSEKEKVVSVEPFVDPSVYNDIMYRLLERL